jgi:hypothetical protein
MFRNAAFPTWYVRLRRASPDGGPDQADTGNAPDSEELPSLGYSFYQRMRRLGWRCTDFSDSPLVSELLAVMQGRVDRDSPEAGAPTGRPVIVQMVRGQHEK